MTVPLLAVSDLRGGYGDITALRDVTLTVEPGEIVTVLGPNGAGKTTLLNTIAGLVPAMEGTIELRGSRIDRLPAYARLHEGLALVQENKRVFKRMTVRDNLVVAAPRVATQEFDRRVSHVTRLFPALEEKMAQPAGDLSGGQQQMLAIGQALMAEPAVLLLDEPSAGLAPKLTAEVMDRVAEIAGDGLGVLLVEQAVHEALRVATRVYTLRLGELSEQPDFRSAGKRELLERVYLGATADAAGRTS